MYFPLFLDISQERFLIIGAGQIAIAKLETILEFTKNVTVIAKEASPESLDFIKSGGAKFILGAYDKKYLENSDIVIAATHDKEVNQQIADESKS